jgi:adenylate cyclase
MMASRRRYRFSTVLLLAFFSLSVPILSFVLIFSYIENARSMLQVLNFDLRRAEGAIVRTVVNFFAEAVGAVEGLSEVAAHQPGILRSPQDTGLLRSSLVAIDHLDGLTVTFEDGSSIGATRIDEMRRAAQPEIPQSANWHTFSFEPSDARSGRIRHQTFYDTWPHVVLTVSGVATYEPRSIASYQKAKESLRTSITKPSLNPVTGERIISVSAPIMRDGAFQGAVSANFNVSEISHFLATNRVTGNSVAAIVDSQGQIIVPPVREEISEDPQKMAELQAILSRIDSKVAGAFAVLNAGQVGPAIKSTTIDEAQEILSLVTVDDRFGLNWRLLIITPKDDFIGPLRETNNFILWLLVVILPVQLLLIKAFARRISQGIEFASRSVNQIRSMRFDSTVNAEFEPKVREIFELSEGVELLRSALQSFAYYIPVGIVRQLVESGKPLELGVEKRRLTMLFADLENFSTVSQIIPPDQLLEQLSAIFSCATSAISDEGGTVDKFIGDSVMAFWGAPSEVSDHALRGCRAALRIAARIDRLNREWREQGRPTLRIRIGLHTAEVLVGNIGTPDRLSYTAIGDGVNVASRLEGINKQFGTTICISEELYGHVAEVAQVRPLGSVAVKGRSGESMVYELLHIRGCDLHEGGSEG